MVGQAKPPHLDAQREPRVRAERDHVHGGGDREARQPGVDQLVPGQVVEEVGRVDEYERLLVQKGQDVLETEKQQEHCLGHLNRGQCEGRRSVYRDVDVSGLDELDQSVDSEKELPGLVGVLDDLDLSKRNRQTDDTLKHQRPGVQAAERKSYLSRSLVAGNLGKRSRDLASGQSVGSSGRARTYMSIMMVRSW